DAKKLLLTMADREPGEPDDPAAGGGRGGAAGANAPAPKPIVIDRYKFKQDVQGYLTQKPSRIYLYDLASKKADALTSETLEVGQPSWSPDGQSIAFMGRE